MTAAGRYNELIESDSALMEESRLCLLERLSEARLIFGGRTLAPYLRPHFVTRAEWQQISRACESAWSAIEKVGRAAPHDELIFEQLGLTEGERELVRIDPGYEDVSVTSRLDSFLTPQSYRFVELNAECPAGIAYADVASEIFLSLPVMRRFTREHKVTPMYCRQLLLDSLLAVYERVRGRAQRPNIAIVDYRGLPTQREFELFKEFFESRGYRTTIADPRDLEMRAGRLHHGDFRIDAVYRRVLTTELLERKDECLAFIEAYKTGAAVFVNSFRTKYVHKKMLFGVLTDHRHRHYFDNRELEAIRLHIPWTRRVEDAKTTYNDEEIDLLRFIRANRDRLVLKPNDEYGGSGIFIGWETEEREWDEAIEKALAGDYLAQERVPTGREVFPWVNESEGRVEMREQLLDLDPLLFFGRARGAFTRLSSSSLANVTSGAGMVPTMIVE
ncbi:MAG: circularly permuted type 2 ATP-grasp protein [Acidobacteriota bacterium]